MIWPNDRFPPGSALKEHSPDLADIEHELRAQIELARAMIPRVAYASEHMGFDPAYASAATATIGLLSWYWSRVVGGARSGALMGTALTVQTCLGFLLTTLSIRLMPMLVEKVGWRYAFAFLAPGPVFGVLAMLRLRALPEAAKIAQGRR